MAIGARKAFQEDNRPEQVTLEHLLFTAATACPKRPNLGTQQDLESYRRRSRHTGLAMGNAGEGQGSGVNPPEIAFTEVIRTRPSRRWRVLGKSKHRTRRESKSA